MAKNVIYKALISDIVKEAACTSGVREAPVTGREQKVQKNLLHRKRIIPEISYYIK